MQPITKVQGSPEEGSYLSRSQIREQVTGTGAVIVGRALAQGKSRAQTGAGSARRGGPEPGGRRGGHRLRQGPVAQEPGGVARAELSSECCRKSEACFERGRGIISHMFLKDYFYIDNRFFCRLPRIHLERSY